MNRILLTTKGAEKLRAELKKLKSTDRPQVIEAIAEARSHGDLSENAEYSAAKEQQGFIEGRIRELETLIPSAQVIDPASLDAQGKVVFGATVELIDEESGAHVQYQIVGDQEADLNHGQISLGSPIARALIGKMQGDDVTVQTPGGEKYFEIEKVLYI